MKYLLWFLLLWTTTTSADYISISHLQWDERYEPATYAYNKCIESNQQLTGKYSCLEMVRTFISENATWNPILKSATNDLGICQLNYRVHSKFITSDIFTNLNAQADYCVNVWIDASIKWSMPRYANKQYDYKNSSKKNNRLKSLRDSVQLHIEKKRDRNYIKEWISIHRKI